MWHVPVIVATMGGIGRRIYSPRYTVGTNMKPYKKKKTLEKSTRRRACGIVLT
jgi:hypothetical protein